MDDAGLRHVVSAERDREGQRDDSGRFIDPCARKWQDSAGCGGLSQKQWVKCRRQAWVLWRRRRLDFLRVDALDEEQLQQHLGGKAKSQGETPVKLRSTAAGIQGAPEPPSGDGRERLSREKVTWQRGGEAREAICLRSSTNRTRSVCLLFAVNLRIWSTTCSWVITRTKASLS
ncbi:hypothetical protein GW17_00062467 [Ensete ventricosum]|nr:hypothetical protein GW17_00062467 [Ensete ventricosum]RZS27267.1 hypothetical protein BHM03_00060712 [Ensete ventricosum]